MLVLYGTEHCHLCEQAAAELHRLNLAYIEVDIVDDDALLERYGTLIPVIRDEFGRELRWPFTGQEISDFFSPE